MDNFKVYYGEYSLAHWLKLILKKEIELPPYQRNFVWTEEKVKKLIKSLQDGLFVPPVIIGTYIENDEKKHYIIDGQQRLSAILLAYLKKFPNRDFETKEETIFADDNDDNYKEEDTDNSNIKDWKLTNIQNLNINYKNKENISSKLTSPRYKEIEIQENMNEEFLNNKFLGFSYIKPNKAENGAEQKRYYSSIFRNINISGMKLTPEESRSSLYWLDSSLECVFKPTFFSEITIDNNKIDFARYLAFTAEFYTKHCKADNIEKFTIAKGYGNKVKPFEEYIEKFVYHAVGEKENSTFMLFEDIFQDIEQTKSQIFIMSMELTKITVSTKFSSIIDADYYLFGLIFWVLFKGKKLKTEKLLSLRRSLQERISEIKKDPSYLKRPSSVGKLRERIYESIIEYQKILED